MNKNDQQWIAQKIRTQYIERQNTELDTLRALDTKAKRPANVFAYLFGGFGAVIMGSGMSLVMTDIGTTIGMENAMISGIVIGAIGLLIACINYPLYRQILNRRKQKYAQEILKLSEKLINEREFDAQTRQ